MSKHLEKNKDLESNELSSEQLEKVAGGYFLEESKEKKKIIESLTYKDPLSGEEFYIKIKYHFKEPNEYYMVNKKTGEMTSMPKEEVYSLIDAYKA